MKPKSRINEMQRRNVTICEYCGAEKAGISFVIGASREPDWVMVEGTGAMCCPICWERGMADGREAVERHIAWVNKTANEKEREHETKNQ